MTKVDHRLYAIVDDDNLKGRNLAELALQAALNGATLLQYRAKTAPTRAMVEAGRAIHAALAGTGVPLLVNDRIDVALAIGAEGVHLGEDDMDPADARRLLGPDAVIGLTVKRKADARRAITSPIDYATIGGVFATSSKVNDSPPVGLDGFRQLAALIRAEKPALTVGAIAGIEAGNAASVIEAGADGIAVISALFKARDIPAASRDLSAIVDAALARRGP